MELAVSHRLPLMFETTDPSETVRAVFGVPLFNQERFLGEALESLARQTFESFAVVLYDDCSTDRTPELAREWVKRDPRFHFYEAERQRGLIGAWCEAFRLARAICPEARYFAWGSDHDIWHPEWLSEMTAALDQAPDAVLAYPEAVRVSETGEQLQSPWRFDTRGHRGPLARMRAAHRGGAKGDMVYGLFRSDALNRCGVLRPVLMPDRLLISEIALYGDLVQVPRVLWSRRRFDKLVSLASQRSTLFQGPAPLSSFVPWPLAHAVALARDLVLDGKGAPLVDRWTGAVAASSYLGLATANALRSRARRLWLLRLQPVVIRISAGIRRSHR